MPEQVDKNTVTNPDGSQTTTYTYTDTATGDTREVQSRVSRQDIEKAREFDEGTAQVARNLERSRQLGRSFDDTFDGTTNPTPSSGGTMAHNSGGTATGDVHDVETCDAQLDALDEDLQRINASVEAIDEAVSDAGAAAERIKAWLESKNVEDAAVAGMATVMEMLNPERIKELFDAVDNARRGVQATKESLTPLREAAGMLNGADGSVLNGR